MQSIKLNMFVFVVRVFRFFFNFQEGVRLSTICEADAWVWSVSGRAGHDEVAVGCDGGSIRVHKLHFQHVRAIYKVSGVFLRFRNFAIGQCRFRGTVVAFSGDSNF